MQEQLTLGPVVYEPVVLERFWAKVDKSGECWVWTAYRTPSGYGQFSYGQPQKSSRAHRFAYEITIGPIPAELVTDHLCRNRACVNPAHLELVTNRENILRGESFSAKNARATHCPQGHEYTLENTIVGNKGGGVSRTCRACDLARKRLLRARKREAKR